MVTVPERPQHVILGGPRAVWSYRLRTAETVHRGGSLERLTSVELQSEQVGIRCRIIAVHQYSSANMIVITRSVTEGSDGSGE